MNPTSNSMLQNPKTPAYQQPRRLPGSNERMYTAIVQLICGFVAVTCGLEFILIKPGISADDQKKDYIADVYLKVVRLGNTGFGLWGGLIFLATASPYLFGRNKKCMVAFYFGSCLVSAVTSAVGIGLSVVAVNGMSYYRSCEPCYSADWQIRDRNPCCFHDTVEKFEYCDLSKGFPYSYNPFPRDIFSLECGRQRELARNTVKDCCEEARQMYVPQLIFYGILLATVSLEFFASFYGASSALMAFCSCKCCCERQQTTYYLPSSCHFVVNDGCINFTVPPPVNIQHPKPETFHNTTEIPQKSPPPYVPH